jgi:hypothetical protein
MKNCSDALESGRGSCRDASEVEEPGAAVLVRISWAGGVSKHFNEILRIEHPLGSYYLNNVKTVNTLHHCENRL